MSAQMARLLQILDILPRHPKFLSVQQMHSQLSAQGITVSIRTIQRDMLVLEEVFGDRLGVEAHREFCHRTGHDPAGDTDTSNHWFWRKEAPIINFAGLTINQALSLAVMKKYLAPLFPKVTLDELEPLFKEAERTLETHEESTLVEWPKKMAIIQPTQPLLMPEVNPEIHGIVSEALLAEKQLIIDYRRSDGIENRYQLNPLGWVYRNGSTYLIATKAGTEDKRIFVLHRIRYAEQLNDTAMRPNDFDLQKHLDEGHMGFDLTGGGCYQSIKLKAIFDQITANHLSESRLSEDQTIESLDKNRFMITATVQETEQLFWWLLSFGFRVEVLEPASLREKMANSVKVLAEKYGITESV
jgi:predicted DNA-binding transcriptional regulator YafY